MTLYYAATIVFLVFDYLFDINVRIAFLQQWPSVKLAYYMFCFGCLALMIWRPDWAPLVAAAESLTAVTALTLSMGVRVLTVSDDMIETGRGFVTSQEVFNYVIVGSVAYWSYMRSIKALKASKFG